MLKRIHFSRVAIVGVVMVLMLGAMLPGVSAESAALPTIRATRPSGGSASGVAATAAAAATKLAATATNLAGTAAAAATKAANLKATLTPFATTGSEAASQAITSYASSVLGITVTVKKAGGLTGDVNRVISQTPKGSSAQSAVVKLAVITYGAVLSNGGASLSYGNGTVSGDVTVDVQGSSLGAYSLLVSNTGTLNANTALDLAKKTFPNLAGFAYTPQTVSKGYAWYAKGNVSGYNPKTKKFESMAEAIILYVLPGTTGKATVSATVGRGTFATAVKP